MSESGGNQFGEFQAVRELNQVGAATIFSARRKGATETIFAIKALRVPVFLSPEDGRRRIAAFLARATLQKRIAQATEGKNGHWAPIYGEPAALADGAYYVSDLYPLSAAQLAEGRRGAISSAELHAVIRQVTTGLQEIQSVANRPHANLAPGNVLLRGRGSKMQAFLADPLEDDRAAQRQGIGGDLRAVGALLHQLVLHAPSPSASGAALPDKPQWHALGETGVKWRELCGRLLGAGQPIASLDDLATQVDRLRPRVHRAWRRTALVAAMLAVVTVSGAWVLHKRCPYSQKDWQRLCDRWSQYDMPSEQLRQRLQRARELAGNDSMSDADFLSLQHFADQVDHLISPRTIAGKPGAGLDELRAEGPGMFHCEAGRQVVEDLKSLDTFDQSLLRFAADRKLSLEEGGQKRKVEQLAELPLRVGWQARVAIASADLESLQRAFGADPYVAAFCVIIKNGLKDGSFPTGDVSESLARLKTLHRQALTLLEVAGGSYALDRIRAEVSPKETQNGSDADSRVDQWRQRADQFKYISPDPREAERKADLASLDALKDSAAKAGAGDDVFQQIQKQREQIISQLGDGSRRPVEAERPAIDQSIQQSRRQTEDFVSQVSTRYLDIGNWITQYESRVRQDSAIKDIKPLNDLLANIVLPRVQQLRTSSDNSAQVRLFAEDVLSQAQKLCDALNQDEADGSILYDRRHHLMRQQDLAALPTGLREWADQIDQAGWKYCAYLFQQQCAALKPDSRADQIRAALSGAAGEWKSWRAQARASILLAGKLQASVSAADGMWPPDRAQLPETDPALKQYDRWRSAAVEWQKPLSDSGALSAPVVDPLATFALANSLNKPASLASALRLSDAQDAGVVLLAWRTVPDRLSGSEALGFTLKEDIGAFSLLSRWAGQIKDAARQKEVAALLAAEIQTHWTKWSQRLALPEPAQDLPDVAALDARLQYDAALYRLQAAVASARSESDDAAIKTAVSALQSQADALDAQSAPPARTFVTQLTASINQSGVSRTAQWGPEGLPGWTRDVVSADRLSFSYKPKASNLAPFTVTFAPVNAEGRKTYLATAEISEGLFFAMVDELANRDDLPATPRADGVKKLRDTGTGVVNYLKSLEYNGPMIWTVSKSGVHLLSTEWLSAADVPGGRAVTNPAGDAKQSAAHPMQFVSPTAASQWAAALGFRLPTVAEWKDAYAQEMAMPRKPSWNLRNTSWTQQRGFASRLAAANPDSANVLVPLDPANWNFFSLGRPDVDSVNDGGGKLFPMPTVPQPQDNGQFGNIFYHLAGNVAEIVNQSTQDTSFAIIGGSVFSPKAVAVDKEIPLAPPQADEAWSDVGFRLALTPPQTPYRELVAQALKNAQFIPD